MIRVGIVGAKGYTAGELVRLLARHPEAQVTALMARVDGAEPIENYFPALRSICTLAIEPIDRAELAARCDVVFLALPHTAAQEFLPGLIEAGLRVIDLSADFRFDSIEVYERTYGVKHLAPELNALVPYALPELYREELTGKQAMANPGCYTSASILALAPLMAHGDVLDLDHIVINAMSGVSGAGRAPSATAHFPECNESVSAYGVAKHRHRPEIEEQLSKLAGRTLRLTFTPHLLPITRGILATCTVPMLRPVTTEEAHGWLAGRYAGEPFVRVLPPGQVPSIAAVAMSNFCDIGVVADTHSGQLIVIATIDNLTKGASGQAIQNMNLMFGLSETLGLL